MLQDIQILQGETARMQTLATARQILFRLLILACGMVAAGPAAAQGGQAATMPLIAELPLLQDDLAYESLAPAIERSLHYLRQLPGEKVFLVCGKEYSAAWLSESLLTFQRIIQKKPSAQDLTAIINQNLPCVRRRAGPRSIKSFLPAISSRFSRPA